MSTRDTTEYPIAIVPRIPKGSSLVFRKTLECECSFTLDEAGLKAWKYDPSEEVIEYLAPDGDLYRYRIVGEEKCTAERHSVRDGKNCVEYGVTFDPLSYTNARWKETEKGEYNVFGSISRRVVNGEVREEAKYDKAGRCVAFMYSSGYGSGVDREQRFSYNPDGTVKETRLKYVETNHGYGDYLWHFQRRAYGYDEEGRKRTEDIFDKDNKVVKRIRYDEDGKQIFPVVENRIVPADQNPPKTVPLPRERRVCCFFEKHSCIYFELLRDKLWNIWIQRKDSYGNEIEHLSLYDFGSDWHATRNLYEAYAVPKAVSENAETIKRLVLEIPL